MAFDKDPTVSSDSSPKGHGMHLTGTAYSTLCGHGYRENGVSHLEPIMRLWERHMGLGSYTRSSNKAMEVGKTMEGIAYEACAASLRSGELHDEESYQDARLYEVYRGMYIAKDNEGGILPDAANIDGPIVDTGGTYTDPKSGAEISGIKYAMRRAQEAAMIARREEDNQMLRADGEEPLPIPEKKYVIPESWMGAIDVKVTQLRRVWEENRLTGIPPAWPVQVAHYNRMLREENERNGIDTSSYPNTMGVYQYCTEAMDGYYYALPHDPELEKEMDRRAELFRHCVANNIPPNSSEMAPEFYVYKVKGVEPKAIVPTPEMEEVFAQLVTKRDNIDGAIKQLQVYRANVDQSLEKGLRKLNYRDKDTVPKGVIIDTQSEDGKGIRHIHMKDGGRKSTVINEAALNATLMAAVGSKELQEKMGQALNGPGDDAQKVAKLTQLVNQLGRRINGVPDAEAGVLDFGHFISKQLKGSEKGLVLGIQSNKEIRQIYEREKARGQEVGHDDALEGGKPNMVNRNDQEVGLPEGEGVGSLQPEAYTGGNVTGPNPQQLARLKDQAANATDDELSQEPEEEPIADRMELPSADNFPSY